MSCLARGRGGGPGAESSAGLFAAGSQKSVQGPWCSRMNPKLLPCRTVMSTGSTPITPARASFVRLEKLTRNWIPTQLWQLPLRFTDGFQSWRSGWTSRISPLGFISPAVSVACVIVDNQSELGASSLGVQFLRVATMLMRLDLKGDKLGSIIGSAG